MNQAYSIPATSRLVRRRITVSVSSSSTDKQSLTHERTELHGLTGSPIATDLSSMIQWLHFGMVRTHRAIALCLHSPHVVQPQSGTQCLTTPVISQEKHPPDSQNAGIRNHKQSQYSVQFKRRSHDATQCEGSCHEQACKQRCV